jgi:SAM-dependent methyltransferase
LSNATTMDQFKQRIIEEWTDPGAVAAWRKWSPQFAIFLREATDVLVEAAHVQRGMQVLDLASGTGEPALTLAERVGSTGHVTATDLGSGMLAIAEENAHSQGLANMSFRQADVHQLPFADRQFDLVSCRFGVMYFADCAKAMQEIARVLKPGGRVVLAAWGLLEQNQFITVFLMPFLKRVQPPPPQPGAPHPFKFAVPGSLSSELSNASFGHVAEAFHALKLPFPGTPEDIKQEMLDVSAPFHPIINGLEPIEREKAMAEVLAGYRQCYDGKYVNTTGTIVLATGVR